MAKLVAHKVSIIYRKNLCPKIEHSQFKHGAGSEERIPRLLKWKCVKNECSECGIETNLKISKCPILNECANNIPLMEWTYARRAGFKKNGNPNTQLELTNVILPVKEVILKMKECLEDNRFHQAQYEWRNLIRKVDLTMSDSDLIRVLCTDFGATLDLCSFKKDNSSVNNHAVIAIFLVTHKLRRVKFKRKRKRKRKRSDGFEEEDDETIISDCDKWILLEILDQKAKKMIMHFMTHVCDISLSITMMSEGKRTYHMSASILYGQITVPLSTNADKTFLILQKWNPCLTHQLLSFINLHRNIGSKVHGTRLVKWLK